MKNLEGKVALVTGNSRGIGPYISSALAGEGVIIAGVARSGDGLKNTEEKIKAEGGTCHSFPFDISEIENLSECIESVRSVLGEIDILVNNAGIEHYDFFELFDTAAVKQILDTNLRAPMELARLLIPGMKERGGHIVNIASLAGKKGISYNSIYSATKSGMIMWTDGLRQEYEDSPVNFSVICPGFISDAGMFHDGGVDAPVLLGASIPQKVADAVLKAIRKNKAEVIVNRGPMRPLLALGQISPRFSDWVVKRFGVPAINRKRAERNQ